MLVNNSFQMSAPSLQFRLEMDIQLTPNQTNNENKHEVKTRQQQGQPPEQLLTPSSGAALDHNWLSEPCGSP